MTSCDNNNYVELSTRTADIAKISCIILRQDKGLLEWNLQLAITTDPSLSPSLLDVATLELRGDTTNLLATAMPAEVVCRKIGKLGVVG